MSVSLLDFLGWLAIVKLMVSAWTALPASSFPWSVPLGLAAIIFIAVAIWRATRSEAETTRLEKQATDCFRGGQYASAETLLKRVLEIRENMLRQEHPHVATSLNNLALLFYAQGKCADAEPLFKRALAIQEKALGPEHPEVATVLENYADLLLQTKRETEAGAMWARAKAIRAKQS